MQVEAGLLAGWFRFRLYMYWVKSSHFTILIFTFHMEALHNLNIIIKYMNKSMGKWGPQQGNTHVVTSRWRHVPVVTRDTSYHWYKEFTVGSGAASDRQALSLPYLLSDPIPIVIHESEVVK
jgi:hypothetical protein